LKQAVDSGRVLPQEVDDHVRRVLWSMFSAGLIDDPPKKGVVDVVAGFAAAQRIAEESIVLLKNENAQLPLDATKLRSIAVIGPHADVGNFGRGVGASRSSRMQCNPGRRSNTLVATYLVPNLSFESNPRSGVGCQG
jgi:beta-glucosidase